MLYCKARPRSQALERTGIRKRPVAQAPELRGTISRTLFSGRIHTNSSWSLSLPTQSCSWGTECLIGLPWVMCPQPGQGGLVEGGVAGSGKP